VFPSLRKQFAYCRSCSLRFDIEENTIIEAFVRFRFASVAITTYVGEQFNLSFIETIDQFTTGFKGLVALCHSFLNLLFFNIHSYNTITLRSSFTIRRGPSS
jgi:hypothetical protein